MTLSTNLPPAYLDRPHVPRSVHVGGIGRRELLAALRQRGIELNLSGVALFANDQFATAGATTTLATIEITVANLGFAQGATITEIVENAAQLGLSLCPLELGPHLRLQYLDQPEGHIGHPPSQHRAPPGALTIASQPITDDDDTPKGFYLRRINGVLWLRGYHSGPTHVWRAEDHLIFVVRA